MARLTQLQKDELLADFHTGHYTQRELAKKYDVSTATVNKLTKGIKPKHEQKVNAIVSSTADLYAESEQNEHEVNAVYKVVEEKTKHLKLINDNATKLANKLNAMADEISEPQDLKHLVDANDKLAITLKVADRHAPKIDITQNQAQNQIQEVPQFNLTVAPKKA